MHSIKFRVFDRQTKHFFENKSARGGNISEVLLSQEGEIYLHERTDGVDKLTHEKDLFGFYDEKKDGQNIPRFERNMYSGVRDSNQVKYFFNDIVCFTHSGGNKSYGVLVWMGDRLGIGSGPINDYHAIDSITEVELRKTDKAGNIYQHAHLIMGEI